MERGGVVGTIGEKVTKVNAKPRWRRGCQGADQSESDGFRAQHLEKYFGRNGECRMYG